MTRIGSLTRNYYLYSQGVIILYNATDSGTLNRVPEWNSDIYEYLGDSIVMMLGNMTDKVEQGCADHVEVHDKAVEHFQRYKFALHKLISCKTAEGIDEAFQELARILYKVNLNESNPFKNDEAVKSSITRVGLTQQTSNTSIHSQTDQKNTCKCQ